MRYGKRERFTRVASAVFLERRLHVCGSEFVCVPRSARMCERGVVAGVAPFGLQGCGFSCSDFHTAGGSFRACVAVLQGNRANPSQRKASPILAQFSPITIFRMNTSMKMCP